MKKVQTSDSSAKNKPKWKYANEAKKLRRCEFCQKRLNKDEVFICNKCYIDLVLGNNHPR